MAVGPRTLAFISGETTRTGLSNIGAMYAKGTEMKQNRKKLEMEETIFGLKKSALELEAKKDEVSFMGDSALSMKAFYDQGGKAEDAQALWDTMREDAANLEYEMPEQVPDAGMAEGLASRSKQYVNYLNATKASESAKKWQAIAAIASIPPENRSAEQNRMFEALTKPDIAINLPAVTGRTLQVTRKSLSQKEINDNKIKDGLSKEQYNAFESEVSTKALVLYETASDSGKPISMSKANDKAFDELKHKIKSTGKEFWGVDIPFTDQLLYNPDAVLEPEDTGDEIDNPSDLKEGETGIYTVENVKYEFKRVDGELKRRKVE